MRRLLLCAAVLPVVFVLAVAAVAGGPSATSSSATGSSSMLDPALQLLYEDAVAAQCPALPWSVLAAIGQVESHHGGMHRDPITNDVSPPILGPPLDGANGRALFADPQSSDGFAHARGPMQFLPSTWARWRRLGPGRPTNAQPSIDNLADAAASAAALLCADGAAAGNIAGAVFAYNHSTAYVDTVLRLASSYDAGRSGDPVRNEPAPGFASR